MKYRVKTFNDWTRPYSFMSDGDGQTVRERQTDEYETDDADLAVSIVRDWLDAPDRDMTEDDVRKQFDSPSRRVEDRYITGIMNYYNGRLRIFEKFKKDFENATEGAAMKYDIPYELNHFETDDSFVGGRETQHDSYFEVTAER